MNPKSGKDRDDWGSIAEIDDDAREEIRLAALEGEIHGIDRATIGSWKDDKTATSHHTFYVNNAQGRLKLVAKNVVRCNISLVLTSLVQTASADILLILPPARV